MITKYLASYYYIIPKYCYMAQHGADKRHLKMVRSYVTSKQNLTQMNLCSESKLGTEFDPTTLHVFGSI